MLVHLRRLYVLLVVLGCLPVSAPAGANSSVIGDDTSLTFDSTLDRSATLSVSFAGLIGAPPVTLDLKFAALVPSLPSAFSGSVNAEGGYLSTSGGSRAGLTIQSSIINWREFSIPSGGTANFVAPMGAAVLNLASSGPVSIAGNLVSIGRAGLISGAQVFPGPSAVALNTSALISAVPEPSTLAMLIAGFLLAISTSKHAIRKHRIASSHTVTRVREQLSTSMPAGSAKEEKGRVCAKSRKPLCPAPTPRYNLARVLRKVKSQRAWALLARLESSPRSRAKTCHRDESAQVC